MLRPQLLQAIPNVEEFLRFCEVRDYPTRSTILREGDSGDKLYHFGISIEGYVLAQPGIPLILSPKSVLIINLSVWDDAAGAKLNEEVEQITVFESFSGGSIVGTGYTKSREEQLQALARNAAKEIQSYLERQRRDKGWFGPAAQIDKGSEEDKPRVAGQS